MRLVDLPRWAVVGAFLALTLGPLVLLAYFSVRLASDAVNSRTRDSLRVEASISALYIKQEMRGLTEVNDSFAHRPLLIRTLSAGPGHYDLPLIRRNLGELSNVRAGIGTAFLAAPNGRLIDIVPATPSIVGKDFSFRDWYQGVRRTGASYVSRAYETQANNHAIVVAVASPVRTSPRTGVAPRLLAIIVVAYRLNTIQAFAARFARTQDLTLTVTDQAGVLLAGGSAPQSLASRPGDHQVNAALRGLSGVAEIVRSGRRVLAGWAPVPSLHWAVVAAVPSSSAFRQVNRLRRTVLIIAGLLGAVLLAGVFMLDVTLRLRQAAQRELRKTSLTDALTAVPNRRAWDDALPREIARARRDRTPLTIAVLDLDHFKDFNDTAGHQAGDVLLRETASNWCSQLRVTDMLARYGGEEFAVALPACPVEEAVETVERLRLSMPGGQTCSIGVATWNGRETSAQLVGRADAALYEAKRGGRDRVIAAEDLPSHFQPL